MKYALLNSENRVVNIIEIDDDMVSGAESRRREEMKAYKAAKAEYQHKFYEFTKAYDKAKSDAALARKEGREPEKVKLVRPIPPLRPEKNRINPYTPPEGHTVQPVPEDVFCTAGMVFKDDEFIEGNQ
jgi:hypothetical protein